MFRILFSAACAALLTLTLRAEDKPATKETPAIVGHWVVTEAQAGDKKIELRQDMVFKSNGKMNLIDRSSGKQSLFRYELDTKASPQRLTLTYLGPDDRMRNLRQLCIWKLERDALTILLGQPKTGEHAKKDKYPSELTKPGKTEILLTFEKMVIE